MDLAASFHNHLQDSYHALLSQEFSGYKNDIKKIEPHALQNRIQVVIQKCSAFYIIIISVFCYLNQFTCDRSYFKSN